MGELNEWRFKIVLFILFTNFLLPQLIKRNIQRRLNVLIENLFYFLKLRLLFGSVIIKYNSCLKYNQINFQTGKFVSFFFLIILHLINNFVNCVKSGCIRRTQCTILCQIISNAKKTTIQKFFFFFFTIWHENHLPSRSKLCKTCSHNQNLYIYWKKSLTLSSKCHYARITSLIGVKQKLNQGNEFNVFKNWLKWWSRGTISTELLDTWTLLNQPQGKTWKLKIL